MTKQVDNVDKYSASCDEVIALLGDANKVKTKYETLGSKNVVIVDSRNDDSGILVKTERDAAQDLPGYAKKVVGETAHLTQTDTWGPRQADGTRDGTWDVVTKGAPAKIGGTLRIEPTADGGSQVITKGSITIKLPFIGGKFEGFTEDSTKQQMAAEYAYHLKHL